MGTGQVVIEQVWGLLAISFVDSNSVRHEIPGAFLHKGSSRLQSQNQQNLKPPEEVVLMKNWR